MLALVAASLLCACSRQPTALDQIRASGQLRVVTLNQPTSYYLGSHGGEGLEFELATAFARRLDLQLNLRPVRDLAAARDALEDGDADLVAAQITAAEDWKRIGLVTVSYQEVPQLVVQRRGAARPGNVLALRGKRIVVWAGSPQQELLGALRRNGAEYLSWTELARDQADPLDWVSSGDADFAIVDANRFAFARYVYPETVVAFALDDPRPLQWVVRKDSLALRDAANSFLQEARNSGLVERLEKAARNQSRGFEYQEAARFQTDVAARLPALRPAFEAAAASTGLDWRLLAAVGYQESHWDAASTSGDGASGIMMLTAATAQSVGVRDRLDPTQSILGGAVYLRQIVDRVPARIAEPDRTWLALAAYNIGFGHLEDARVLAQMRGRNPDRWADVREMLPLLAQEPWFLQARRGYARGWEPVRYVEQVRGFLSVLQWYEVPVEDLGPLPTALNPAAGGRRTHATALRTPPPARPRTGPPGGSGPAAGTHR